jgi:hypothetical protein
MKFKSKLTAVSIFTLMLHSASVSGEVQWNIQPNVAQYKGADWKNEVRREGGITLEQAKKIGASDPDITFFFYVKGRIRLEGKSGPNGWTEKGTFRRGDAVFFTGKPWYGSAPGKADAYEKTGVERTGSVDPVVAETPSVPDQTESPQAVTKSKSHETGVYDTLGNRVFYVAEGILFDDSGNSYAYDGQWQRITRNGGVIMNYRYNQRQWEWVEGVTPKSSPLLADRFDKDSVRRIYKRIKGVYRTTEQGDFPILRYKDGDYINEFGEPVYSLRGRFPGWCSIILLHRYYEKVYKSDAFGEIMAKRAVNAELFASENSIVVDMLNWGKNFEAKYKKRKMVNFTSIEGKSVVLSNDQIEKIQNQWLILNQKRWHSSYSFEVPEAGFTVSERKAKKRGVEGDGSKRLVLEIKVKPEYMVEFQSAISR